MKKFPREAGREVEDPSPRLIPLPPDRLEHGGITVVVTRKTRLDGYIRSLCRLLEAAAGYVLSSIMARNFFAIKPGDVEVKNNLFTSEAQAIASTNSSQTSRVRYPPTWPGQVSPARRANTQTLKTVFRLFHSTQSG